MDIPVTQLPPGDPRLVEAIVGQLKSRGIFDQFRKECLADVDLKPAYQNLRQRVEGQVNKFLEKQIWKNDLNKNQLRESVRKHVHDAGMLGPGIDAIISQVVNPKINSLILPLVEDTVYAFLQIDKPKRESKVMSEPERDIMNYHIRDQNGQHPHHHHHHPPVMPKPHAPPPARAPLIPMDTDAISSEEDEILAHESPESGKRTSDEEKMELQMMDDNARDGFEDKSKIIGDGGLYGPDSVVESVEKLKIKEEPSRGTKDESTSQEQVKPPMLLFDNQSLDSISSNSSGLTFSPLSGRGSVKDEKLDDEGESSPPPSSEVREKHETGQNSNRSTPLIDEVKVEEGGSGHDIGSQLSQDLRSSRVGDPLEDAERSNSKETHPPVPSPSRLPSLPQELSKEGNRKTISGASPISLDEDSEMSKCSQGTNSSRGEKSEGELSSKSEGEISSKSLKSEGEVSGKSGEPKIDKVDKEPSIKSEKSEGEITSSSDSESRDTRDSYKPKRPDERHGSREDRHRSDGHRHKHDSRSSKERERDREKEKKREKSKDDHHSYKDKDRKHDRRDRDRDRDRSRGHHHSSSSSRKESSSSSSDRRDKERSGHYSSDRSTKEGKSRSSGSSEKQEKKKVENKGDQGKNDLKVEEKKRDIKIEKSSDKSEIKKEAKADIRKSENKNVDKKSESKKLDSKQEDRQDRDSKDKSVKSKIESKDKKDGISIKSSKHSDKDKKDKKDKDKKNDDKTSSKGKTGDRKPIEKKQIIVSLGKDRPMDKEPKNSLSKDIKKSKIASNNNETKTLNKARNVGSTKNNLDGVDLTSYGIDREPMVLVSNDGNLLFVNYSDEKKKKKKRFEEAKSSSSDSDGCRTPPLVDSPKSKSKPFISKREASALAKSVPLKKRKEMNMDKGDSTTTLKSVSKAAKKRDTKVIASPTKLKSLPSKRKFKEAINFEGFEAFERNTRLRTFLDSVVIIPDPLEEEDMQPDDYFLVVSETQLPENFSIDDFVKQVEWMGVRVNQRTGGNSTHTETSKGEESEVSSDRSRARNRKRQASMSSTASNSSASSTSGSSPKAKRMRRNVGQGKENEEEEVVCLEDDRTNADVLVAGYALPTPEDDGHRTSTREYEVDYSRRESSYSPLSPSSDSSEDTKAKATAGTSICGAPTMPEFWKSGNSKHHPHHKQASLLINLNNGKVSVAKVGQQSSSISKRGQDCKTAQLYKLPFSKPGSQPS